MMLKGIRILLIISSILLCISNTGYAQQYSQTPVTVSKDKTRGSDGKIYYSHVVQEKQTLFSIAKAYNVTIVDIYNANPTLNIKEEGLKKNSIILIPVVSSSVASKEDTKAEMMDEKSSGHQKDEYRIHIVKWYEDIEDIASKYGVSKDEIIRLNNLKSSRLKSRMELKIPTEIKKKASDSESVSNKVETMPATKTESDEEKNASELNGFFNWAFSRGKKNIDFALVLPFNASSNPNSNYFDFYNGVLLAVRDMSKEGISTDMSVYDFSGASMPLTAERIKSSDFIIGPVSAEEIKKVMAINQSKTPVISPLDQKVENLVSSYPILVQAPSPYDAQYKDVSLWVKEDYKSGDKVIVVYEKGNDKSGIRSSIMRYLGNEGIAYSTFSYSIIEGRNAISSLSSMMTDKGRNRIIFASESEAFAVDLTRNLNLLSHRNMDIVLYGTSKLRSFNTVEVESLHELNLHLSTSYYIDYENDKVNDFVLQYRALFKTEPTQFSFQGYDLASFFIKTVSEYGDKWLDNLMKLKTTKMLQSDFLFKEKSIGGFVNTGVRRMIYNNDFSIDLLED